MSRFLIAASLITAMTSFASADRATEPSAPETQQRYAQPPGGGARAEYPVPMAPRALDRDTVRAKLVANRAANLARFRAYQKAGVFPANTYSDQKRNVWLDDQGHFCAAATIIKMSGQDDLVSRVAEQNNFIRLADVKQGPLMDWILTSGLTQDEIVAIQEPMMPISHNPGMDPVEPAPIDVTLRDAENKRLVAKYRQVDAMIVKNQKKSIELAVDRVMSRPDLAWQLVDPGYNPNRVKPQPPSA
jgi:hypothetical protein